MIETIVLKPLKKSDAHIIATAFQRLGWNKPSSQYKRYLSEQDQGARVLVVACLMRAFGVVMRHHETEALLILIGGYE